MIRALLIDDEPIARARLRQLLSGYKDELVIVGEASNGEEGAELIDALLPDVVFVDIEMPVLNGFDMLAKIKHQPIVIFATAYDQFAIKAFEENSIDYLLKPIEEKRLERTLEKLRNNSLRGNIAAIGQLSIIPPKEALKTITVKIGDRILLLRIDDVLYLEAEDKYVFLYTKDGQKHITDYSLTALQDKLSDDFLRIHRALIINSSYIKEIRKGFNGSFTFVLRGTEEVRLKSSRSYGEQIKLKLGI
ncbi:LytR/AlgR family response regulator transcription factor [Olivibacter sitiensis]|uniref:LytR/AlgR family response regulator transcription factor n=1 Tax=Olivibacter sitiensis TaxID=376470 RepID=UPI000418CF36|nr:LytTR family transcriptional regulator DNA-binding domain-containing protein [Olivibacter sitiensis]